MVKREGGVERREGGRGEREARNSLQVKLNAEYEVWAGTLSSLCQPGADSRVIT